MATSKKQPAKKLPAPTVKKVVEKTPTLEQQLKQKSEEFTFLSKAHARLAYEHCSLKNSFAMLKDNFEREKNRLDKVIDVALNNSKQK